ncbi:MAG: hypothetical protein JKY04_02155 [Sneathiella sp.]|nr:hypothetical protein [Sneathiella sp.]
MISVASALPTPIYSARISPEALSAASVTVSEKTSSDQIAAVKTSVDTPLTPTEGDRQLPSSILSKDVVTQLQGAEENERPAAPPQQEAQKPADAPDSIGLTEAEQVLVDNLQERDTEVRAHEQAHASTGGAYAGSPTYEYETGPDGRQYAIGGEVSIDTSPIAGDPSATISKMETIIRAALAPAEPSGQDRSVAATASKLKLEAQAELNAEKQASLNSDAVEQTSTATGNAPPQSTGGAPPPQGSSPIIDLIA